jgi:RNA-directed DNA polymerase
LSEQCGGWTGSFLIKATATKYANFYGKSLSSTTHLKMCSSTVRAELGKAYRPAKACFIIQRVVVLPSVISLPQLLSNIYLDQLDRFVTLGLGFKHYGRYVDDFYIVSTNKAELIKATATVERYLDRHLALTLHPHKRHLQECHKGVAFLGAVVYPHRIHPGKRLKHNLLEALSHADCSKETAASYGGW